MRVFMAPGAHLRRSCEIHILQGHFHGGRTMAVNACDPAVRARKGEFRRRVIEARHFVPLHHGVAGLATWHRAVRPPLFHLRAEFALVHIIVANRAGPIVESIFHWGQGTFRHWLVAVRARYRDMRAGQREARLFVLGQRIHCRAKCLVFYVVAIIAAIQRRRRGKLRFVNVFVAILALRRDNLVQRIFAIETYG